MTLNEYELSSLVKKYQPIIRHTIGEDEQHLMFFLQNNKEISVSIKKNNEILGAIDLLLFNEIAVQVGVTTSPKREYRAGPFLTWNTIKWTIDENLKTFDFGGANPTPKTEKERQIDFYKSKWNNEKKEYFFFTKIFNRNKIRASSVLKRTITITYKIAKQFSK